MSSGNALFLSIGEKCVECFWSVSQRTILSFSNKNKSAGSVGRRKNWRWEDGTTSRVWKVLHGHCINAQGKVCLRIKQEDDLLSSLLLSAASEKLTLANDSHYHHQMAKGRLVYFLAIEPEGKKFLDIIEVPPRDEKQEKALAAAVKTGLALLFDVGPDFIETEFFRWDLKNFRKVTMAYHNVFGEEGMLSTCLLGCVDRFVNAFVWCTLLVCLTHAHAV